MNYYDQIADGYDELHKEEQLKKLAIIKNSGIVKVGDNLLDVGCGSGFSLDYFNVSSAVGVDPSAGLVSKYSGNQKIMVERAEQLNFEDDLFDVVISITAIQNFDCVPEGLKEIKRVGKKRFALTYLKKSSKAQEIEDLMSEIFAEFSIKRIEEEKDIIFLIKS